MKVYIVKFVDENMPYEFDSELKCFRSYKKAYQYMMGIDVQKYLNNINGFECYAIMEDQQFYGEITEEEDFKVTERAIRFAWDKEEAENDSGVYVYFRITEVEFEL